MSILASLSIIALAAIIHSSFQLSISVLTLLSGHAIGARHSRARILKLTSSFIAGAVIMTLLLLATLSFVIMNVFGGDTPQLVWASASGLMIGVGVAVWLYYYRKEQGTSLWIPRPIALFLTKRTKATKQSAESFSLGMMSVVGELLFIVAPLFLAALVLVQLPAVWQLFGILSYAFISALTLFTVWVLIGSGHKLSRIQKWREDNKGFLQFAAGAGLIILAIFTFVFKSVGNGF